MSRAKHEDKLLLNDLREKYETGLDTIEDCQRILRRLLKENRGDIMTNSSYHTIDERCQKMIIFEENLQTPKSAFYRLRQDRIERIADKYNCPSFPENLKQLKKKVGILLRKTYAQKDPKRYSLEQKESESI
jgi:hypothetical protein